MIKGILNLAVLVFFILSITQCGQVRPRVEFDKVQCAPEPTPEYDGDLVGILDDSGNVVRDTMISKYVKYRRAFKPCRRMVYRAIFKAADGEVITDSRIQMMALGQRWEVQPEIQDAIIVQYEVSKEDEQRNESFQLNKTLDHGWSEDDETGIIENEQEVWMHPYRLNQFNFTEVAPFPRIKYPLELNRSYTGGLGGLVGWGDWDGYNGNDSYTIVGHEQVRLPYGEVDSCWVIDAYSTWDFGKSYLKFWFSEDLGFVKFNYINYGDQSLSIELEEVIE